MNECQEGRMTPESKVEFVRISHKRLGSESEV